MKNKFYTFKFLSLIISLIISIFFLEVYVRAFVDDGLNLDLEMMKYAKNFKKISKNKNIGLEHRKNIQGKLMNVDIFLNSQGFRNDKNIKLNKKKILLLGDSMTFGWGSQNTFSDVMEKKFNGEFQVLNAGIGNTNTYMQINNYFNNFNKQHYDVIILNFFINDFENVKIQKLNFVQKNLYSYSYIKSLIINYLININVLENWSDFYLNTFKNKNLIEKTFSKINELNNYCVENKILLIINNIPELTNLKNYKFENQTKLIKDFSDKNNIFFLDSFVALKNYDSKSLWVTEKDHHANDKAHKIIGEFLYEKIKIKLDTL